MQKDKQKNADEKELLNDPELSEEAKAKQEEESIQEESTDEKQSVDEGKKKKFVKEMDDDEEESDLEFGDDEEDMDEAKKKKSMKEADCEGDEEEMKDDEKSYKEDLDVLVNSTEGLTEDFREKASVIFEAAITKTVREAKAKLEGEFEAKVNEGVEAARNELFEKVDSYLDYAVTEWVKENELSVDAGLRTEIAEEFMKSLKTLFTEHYIDVPENKVDLYDVLEKKSIELDGELQESKTEIEGLKEQVENLSREKILGEASKGLTSTQAAKLASLVEDVEFVDTDTFSKKVSTVKESYFSGKRESEEKSDDNVVTESKEEIIEGEADEVSPAMKPYTDALSRLFRNSNH